MGPATLGSRQVAELRGLKLDCLLNQGSTDSEPLKFVGWIELRENFKWMECKKIKGRTIQEGACQKWDSSASIDVFGFPNANGNLSSFPLAAQTLFPFRHRRHFVCRGESIVHTEAQREERALLVFSRFCLPPSPSSSFPLLLLIHLWSSLATRFSGQNVL